MKLNNSKELVTKLIDMFKNETEDNPIKIKNLYHCVSQLNYIVFLGEDDEIYWRKDTYKGEDDRISATLFIDEKVFNEWKGEQEVKYKIINFNELMQLLNNTYAKTNTFVFATIILTWDSDTIVCKLDIHDIYEFQQYVLMYNSISNKDAYILGAPSNPHQDFIDKLSKEFSHLDYIKTAYYSQLLSPPQEFENLIESHKPNTTYLTICYDTFEDKATFYECLAMQDKYMAMAKNEGFDLLIVHKNSQVGSLITPTKPFYEA